MDCKKYGPKTTICVSQITKETLCSRKKAGQTYDGLVQDLIDFWDSKHQEYWTRRRDGKIKAKTE